MNSYVLDSSALIAVALQETGREYVKPRMTGALLSTVNLQEIFEIFAERERSTFGLVPRLEQLSITIVEYSARHAELAAALKPVCKPVGISLADRACLALGKERGIPVLTADRSWASVEHGVVVELIR